MGRPNRLHRNRWIGITYIADNQRMEEPPEWFLQQIHDYDAMLVLLPSRQRPFCYIIARRCRLGQQGLTKAALQEGIEQPDTLMCFKYGLLPVCLMYKHGPVWNVDPILKKLRERDLWAQGGADAVADALEAEEQKAVDDRREAKRRELWDLSGEAYRSYKQRTGQRIISAGPARTEAAPKLAS